MDKTYIHTVLTVLLVILCNLPSGLGAFGEYMFNVHHEIRDIGSFPVSASHSDTVTVSQLSVTMSLGSCDQEGDHTRSQPRSMVTVSYSG